jgi:hypothetical protein
MVYDLRYIVCSDGQKAHYTGPWSVLSTAAQLLQQQPLSQPLWSMVYGALSTAYGLLQSMVYGLWSMVYGLWSMVITPFCTVSTAGTSLSMINDLWSVDYGLWSMVYGHHPILHSEHCWHLTVYDQ